MATYSAQNSITVRRLRNGDTLFISLELNGIPLFQGVDEKSGAASPDWTQEANQPVITPKVLSARGNPVELSNHRWSYNGSELTFNGTADEQGFTPETGQTSARFKLNKTTGALKIVANLASKENLASDTLTYTGTATVGGVAYTQSKSIDVMIQNSVSSSYYGYILASTEQLTSEVTSAKLTTGLYLKGAKVTDYYVKWYRDNESWSGKNGQKEVTVSRGDIDGTQLFLAEFYKTKSDTSPIFRAGVRMIDTADEFQINLRITSDNKEVDEGKPVTVTATVVNMTSNTTVTPSNATWRMDVMDKDTWEVLKSASASNISVTTSETDKNGEMKDVEVLAEVTWN